MPLEVRRSLVIEAAVWVFANEGLAATTVDSVAEKAAVSKASIYGVVRSKDELLEVAAHEEFDRFVNSLLASQARHAQEPRLARARARFAAVFDYARERPHGFAFLIMLRDNKVGPVAALTREVRRTLTQALASDMAVAGMATGAVAEILATVLIGMAEAGVRATEISPGVDADAVVDLLTGITSVGLVGLDKSILARLVPAESDATSGVAGDSSKTPSNLKQAASTQD